MSQEKTSVAPFRVFSDVDSDLIFKSEPIVDEKMKDEEEEEGQLGKDEKLEPVP